MKERLSAFVDGEFESRELQAYLARIKSDAELRGAWNTYHMIGDALRGNIRPDLASLVVARLRDEPTMLAPRQITPVFRRVGWYALSAAAGVAAVTLVVWTALPVRQTETQATAKSESIELARSAPVATVSVPTVEVDASLSSAAVENYLYAHQTYSHASAMQGVAPYARTIAEERGAESK